MLSDCYAAAVIEHLSKQELEACEVVASPTVSVFKYEYL